MSTYPTSETALLTLLRAYNSGATFTAHNSSADDWLVLDANDTEVCAVIEMGDQTQEDWDIEGQGVQGAYQELHQIDLWLCVKRGVGDGGDGACKQALKTLTAAVLDYLRPYERLNHGAPISRVMYRRTTSPSYISPTNDISAATHVAQKIRAVVNCEATYTSLEHGY